MDRPILFSGPMVRALLEGRKTQTRRALKPLPRRTIFFDQKTAGQDQFQDPRYAVGDRLWVREAWCSDTRNDSTKPSEIATTEPIWFAADAAGINITDWSLKSSKNRPGMFLPRWASRITLTVTDVRVQRLQEISEADAGAEGVLWVPGHGEIKPADLHEGFSNYLNCREGFQVLWDSLNASRGFGWDANPWVVAVSFTVERRNIDQVAI